MFSCFKSRVDPFVDCHEVKSEIYTLENNTAYVYIGGVGSSADTITKKYNVGTAVEVYHIPYASSSTLGNVGHANQDMKNTKKLAKLISVPFSDDSHSYIRNYEMYRILKTLIQSDKNKVVVFGISHGSVVIHAAILRLKMLPNVTFDQLQKLHVVTLGSPQSIPMCLLPMTQSLAGGVMPLRLQSSPEINEIINQVRSHMSPTSETPTQVQAAATMRPTSAQVQAATMRPKQMPRILNIYNVEDTMIFKALRLVRWVSNVNFPNTKIYAHAFKRLNTAPLPGFITPPLEIRNVYYPSIGLMFTKFPPNHDIGQMAIHKDLTGISKKIFTIERLRCWLSHGCSDNFLPVMDKDLVITVFAPYFQTSAVEATGGGVRMRVLFTPTKKPYSVHKDSKKQKYIIMKKQRVYLKDIKGKYRYLRD